MTQRPRRRHTAKAEVEPAATPAPPPRRQEVPRLTQATVLVALALGPALLAGVPAWATVALVTAASLALMVSMFQLRPLPAGRSTACFALTAMTAWTGLQAVPLPCEWVAALSPASAREAIAAAALLENPARCSISRDPGATWEASLRMVAFLAAFVACALVAHRSRRRALMLVAVACGSAAVVAAGHFAVGAELAFGLYEPVHAGPARLGPVLNENHLAGAMLLGFPLLAGLAYRSRGGWRVGFGAGAALCIVVTALSLSRAGIAALGFEVVVVAMLLRQRVKKRKAGADGRRGLFAVAAACAVGVGLGLFVAFEGLEKEVHSEEFQKVELVQQASEFALKNGGVGVGRGAFAATFVREHGVHRRWEHAENFVVHWGAEWGIPFTLFVLVLLTWNVVSIARSTSSLLTRLGVVGLLAFFAQNLVDFGSEVTGIGLLAFALLGALQRGSTDRRWIPRLDHIAWACVLLATSSAWVLAPAAIRQDRQEMTDALTSGQLSESDFRELLREAVEVHPEDPTFAVLAAIDATERRDGVAFRWLNRAMVLAPGWSTPHLQAARTLASLGRLDQAMLELRVAAERDHGHAAGELCSILARDPRAELAARAAPLEGPGRIAMLDTGAECLPVEEARALDEVILAADPSHPNASIRAARRAADAGDTEEAVVRLEQTLDANPSERVRLALARMLLASDRPTEAIETLTPIRNTVAGLELLAEAATVRRDAEGMRGYLAQLRGRAGLRERRLAEVSALEARLERSLGHNGRAIRAYQAAYDYDGRATHLIGLAEAALDARAPRRSLEALDRLERDLDADDGAMRRRVESLRRRVEHELPSPAEQLTSGPLP